MAKKNEWIFKNGTIHTATKLPVLNIGLGLVSDLQDLTITHKGNERLIIWHNAYKQVVIRTPANPDGGLYFENLPAVVRVIGGHVLSDGLYDISVHSQDEIEKLLSNPITLEAPHVTPKMLAELQPLLNIASNVRPSLDPAEYDRKVIIITDDMVGKEGFIECVCTGDEKSGKTTRLFPSDVFVIENLENLQGYRNTAFEFFSTYELKE